ncbi:hypothetical protein J2752_002464 [Halarchaeum rubridurum]|uniref:Uncharacterized protein n=1 Tax=Halarchaeum rubridurum TaxID=489911 RepID=A0A830G2W2_9EURY|nr:hypothetical protein [Halarchaeum rubridurum]MBP1955541.1 hypothetical protein [Halarchaeum rubridurum]GGM73211.1 hypothetical protein GCM10009017_23910 [Halarchaeum rubridurum]
MSSERADSGTEEGWGSNAIGEAFETLETEIERAEADASGARAIALSRSRDLLEKIERTLKKTA